MAVVVAVAASPTLDLGILPATSKRKKRVREIRVCHIKINQINKNKQ